MSSRGRCSFYSQITCLQEANKRSFLAFRTLPATSRSIALPSLTELYEYKEGAGVPSIDEYNVVWPDIVEDVLALLLSSKSPSIFEI